MGKSWLNVTLEQKSSPLEARRHLPSIVVAVAEEARREWSRIAQARLHSTAGMYINSLTVRHRASYSEVILKQKLPNMMENGASPYDLKVGMLASPKAKTSKDGHPYMSIPLPLKAPGGGRRMDMPPVIPRGIYKIVSQSPYGKTTKLPLRFENYGKRTRLSPDPAKWSAYTWKASPFEGIKRMPTASEGKSHYNTFRRVSTKSDPSSWVHPGFKALHLMDQVQNKVEGIFNSVVSNLLR